MGSRRFWSWPAGWAKAIIWGIFVGVVVGALLIVAQGQGSALNQIDWCGTSVVIFFVVVAVTVLVARLQPDRSQDVKPSDADNDTSK